MKSDELSDKSIKSLLKTLGKEAKKRKLKDIKIPKLLKPKGPDKRTLSRTKQEVKSIFDPLLIKFKEYEALLKTTVSQEKTVSVKYQIDSTTDYYDKRRNVPSINVFYKDEDIYSNRTKDEAYIEVKAALDKAKLLKRKIKKDFSTSCKKLNVFQYVIKDQVVFVYKDRDIAHRFLEIL